jgi:hypothetical protein
MGFVGCYASCIHFLAVKLVKDLGLMFQTGVAQQIFRLIGVKTNIMLILQPLLAAEIRDSALRGNAGAPEENKLRARISKLLQK